MDNTWPAGKSPRRMDFLNTQQLNAPQTISVSVETGDGRKYGAWQTMPLSDFIPADGDTFTAEMHWGWGEENHYWHEGPYLVVAESN